jgi:PilZ domain
MAWAIACDRQPPLDIPMNKNRRSKQRFDMELELIYRTLNQGQIVAQGFGTTRNLSSGGLQFQPTDPLSQGDEIELTIQWPALLNNLSRLNLVLRGRVIRCDALGCAAKIERYEFAAQVVLPMRLLHRIPRAIPRFQQAGEDLDRGPGGRTTETDHAAGGLIN